MAKLGTLDISVNDVFISAYTGYIYRVKETVKNRSVLLEVYNPASEIQVTSHALPHTISALIERRDFLYLGNYEQAK